MHSKSHKLCTLKFLGCYLAQRVHGSKVEAKESTENSKVLDWMSWNQVYSVGWSDAKVLTRVRWVLQPTSSKWTVGWTDGTCIGSSVALGFGYSSSQGSALKHQTIRHLDHPTVAFKFNRDASRLLLQHRMNRRLDCILSGSSDALIQIIQYRPKCGAFSTGWSDGASVYSVGALSGFLVQRLYWSLWVTGWSDAQQGEPSVHPTVQLFRGSFPTARLLC
jgi:hypothetical protein